jgi:uncharacterized protein (TIGR02449 family)
MEELIDHLENSIETLLQEHLLLKKENAVLEKHFRQLLKEKDLLLGKNKNAVAQIEQILAHLKSLEQSS